MTHPLPAKIVFIEGEWVTQSLLGVASAILSFFDIEKVNLNGPFAASHSRGTNPPCWKAKVALGQDKQRNLPFQITYVFCLSCPSANFALQRGGFVPRE